MENSISGEKRVTVHYIFNAHYCHLFVFAEHKMRTNIQLLLQLVDQCLVDQLMHIRGNETVCSCPYIAQAGIWSWFWQINYSYWQHEGIPFNFSLVFCELIGRGTLFTLLKLSLWFLLGLKKKNKSIFFS